MNFAPVIWITINISSTSVLKSHSPFKLCVSDQHSSIAGVFAELSYWHLAENLGIKVLELVKEARICVRVAFFLQFLEERPTRLRASCDNDLVEGGRDICWRKVLQCQNTALSHSRALNIVWGVFTFHPGGVPRVQEGSGGFCRCLVLFVRAHGRWLVTKQQKHHNSYFFSLTTLNWFQSLMTHQQIYVSSVSLWGWWRNSLVQAETWCWPGAEIN